MPYLLILCSGISSKPMLKLLTFRLCRDTYLVNGAQMGSFSFLYSHAVWRRKLSESCDTSLSDVKVGFSGVAAGGVPCPDPPGRLLMPVGVVLPFLQMEDGRGSKGLAYHVCVSGGANLCDIDARYSLGSYAGVDGSDKTISINKQIIIERKTPRSHDWGFG